MFDSKSEDRDRAVEEVEAFEAVSEARAVEPCRGESMSSSCRSLDAERRGGGRRGDGASRSWI